MTFLLSLNREINLFSKKSIRDSIFLCIPGSQRTCSLDQTGLKLRDVSVSASTFSVLGLKVCAAHLTNYSILIGKTDHIFF